MTVFEINLYVPQEGTYSNFWSKIPSREQIIERLKAENTYESEDEKEDATRFINTRVELINRGKYRVEQHDVKEI